MATDPTLAELATTTPLPQKRKSRPRKTKRKSPKHSELQTKLWATPEYRAKMIAARSRTAEDRRNNPQKYSRLGVPNGMHKAEATKAWDNARALADTIIQSFEAKGIVPVTVVPDSDNEKAKAALREACVLALGPGNMRTKLLAAAMVLKYTKAPPVQRVQSTQFAAEEWLRSNASQAGNAHNQPEMNNAHI